MDSGTRKRRHDRDYKSSHEEKCSSKRLRKHKNANKETATSYDLCKDVLASHSKEILEILTSVKNGTLSIDQGPPEALALLLNGMVEKVVGQQKKSKAQTDEENKGLLNLAKAGETTEMPAAESFHNEVRTLLPLRAWTVEDIPDDYPPLPPILDPSQEKIAMTHQGAARPEWQLSYETMEFLGDSFIYHVSSELIVQTFPKLSSGRCSQIRERIVRNSTLAEYSLHYKLDKRALLPDDLSTLQDGSGRPVASAQQRQKVYADLFESYVAALIRSDPQGVQRGQQWLRRLWAMTIARDIRNEYRRRSEMSKRAEGGETDHSMGKERLARTIACKPIRIRYADSAAPTKTDRMTNQQLFAIEVWVDAFGKSECLGHGVALSKKEAGVIAAEKAMQNTQKINFYVKKKAEYVKNLEEQMARANEEQLAQQEAEEKGEARGKEENKVVKTSEMAVDSDSDGM